jgi:UDP-galactopyranose mutase
MAIISKFKKTDRILGSDGKSYVKIYSNSLKGLEQLYWTVAIGSKTGTKTDILQAIYKTYSKEQWDMKCKELNYKIK